jgi:monooxygenase
VSLEHVDVLIVGAGLSGIGAACHLQSDSPQKSYAILEAREGIGGTWDLFRYPGIRSDSDMYTLGYRFRPWEEDKSIADGSSILEYVRHTARDHDVERHVRFGHRVVRADWSSADALWTVEATRADTGQAVQLTCGFLFACTGYYRYDEGHTPQFAGSESYTGQIVHPQHWADDVEHAGKRVIVIGSGATAITLVPALAESAAHVTMLQRSPSYVVSLPGEDPLAKLLRRTLPSKAAYAVVRWKNVLVAMGAYRLSRRRPGLVRRLVRRGVERRLPRGYDIDTHFTPTYDPWDQRLCLVPDGDLFEALRSERAHVVTDTIETFTPHGIRLASGRELDADVIVTATGLRIKVAGGIDIVVDGERRPTRDLTVYRGTMFVGVPNLAISIGYVNASWTLRADLASRHLCRLLTHMEHHGWRIAVPRAPERMGARPLLPLDSGYVRRAGDELPSQGDTAPWLMRQNYLLDRRDMLRGNITEAMAFAR